MRPLIHFLLPSINRPAWMRVLVVVACLGAAFALRYSLAPWLGDQAPFAMLLPAVMISAWLGGFRSGLLATVLGAVLAAWFFMGPLAEFSARQFFVVGLFILQGLMTSLLCGAFHYVFKQWQRAREQSQIDFEDMADHAPNFVWSTGADGSAGFVNKAWRLFAGMAARPADVDRLEGLHPEDRERVRAVMAQAQVERRPYQVEYRFARADGVYRWILEHAVPRTGGDGGFLGFVGSGVDVTASHQERDELAFIEGLHRALAVTLDMETAASTVTRALVPFAADWACIQLLDEKQGALKRLGVHHADPEKRDAARAMADEAASLLSGRTEGSARVLREGAPQFVPAVDDAFLRGAAADDADLARLRALGLVSYVRVPLRADGRVVGVLSLATAESRRVFDADTVRLAMQVGGIAAFALENARLYQSARAALAAEKQARLDQDESERRFRSAWDADIFGICIIERDRRFRAANAAFLKLWGYSREDLEAGRIELLSRFEGRAVKFGTFIWEHLAEEGPCAPFEKTCVRGDGREVPVLVGGSVQADRESCIVFMLDLAARKTAEAEVDRQRTLLKTIIDTVPAMVAYIDADERIVLHNRRYEEWLDLGYDDIHGKTVRELLGEVRYQEERPHLHAAMAGNNVRYEKTIHGVTQSRDAMASFRPDFDRAGRVVGAIFHAYDITESRRMAISVARSEKRFRTLITASATIVWFADADGIVRQATGWEAFTGRRDDHGMHAQWIESVHPDDRARMSGEWFLACRESRQWEYIYRLKAADGRYRHVHARAAAIMDVNDKVAEWIGTVTDISQRVEAEQLLRRKEAELKLVMNAIPALIAYVDRDKRYVMANKTHEKWFGLDTETMRGLTVSMVVGEASYEKLGAAVDAALNGEEVSFEESVTAVFSSEPRWLRFTYTPHFGEDGRVLGFFGLAFDITERKNAERDHAELLDRYRFLAEAVPQNIWTANAAGEQDYVNRRWVDYTGLSAEIGCSDRWSEIVHPDDLAETRRLWAEALAEGERYMVEHRLRSAAGDYQWFLTLALARRDAEGRIVQWVGTSTNIDAQRRAYAELVQARAALDHHANNLENEVRARTLRLEEVNTELEAFTYSASHDLRVPLRHIQAFADEVFADEGTVMSPAGRAHMESILKSARRMDTLIVDLLAYSHLSRAELVLESTDLEAVVAEVMVAHRAGIESSGASIRVASPLAVVLAERVGLVQVLSNLLSNALKFVPPGRRPEIVIRSEERGECIRLWVEDNGIGIEARHLYDIFKIFHRLHSVRDYAGTGIGLSLVKKGMVRMGGDCGVESEKGRGSRFWLDFQRVK